MRTRHSRVRKIGVLALPGVQMLDVAGPLDVFTEANIQAGRNIYQTYVVAAAPGPVVASSGLRVLPDAVIGIDRALEFDTLLIAGGPHLDSEATELAVLDWVVGQAKQARRFGSVCSGALVLGAAGLLDGRRVATHWAVAEELARRFPQADVDVDAIHVRDGRLRTAAGVTAGLDMSLALVEEDLGRDVAMKVAAQLVMFFKRPGGQLQFSRRGRTNPAGRSVLQEVQRWVVANPAADTSLAALAAHAGLSARHFARLFRREIGTTPSIWVETVRIDAARRLLEAGERPKQAASVCGFADADTFRRAFQRRVGVTPAEYRRRYAAPCERLD